MKTHLAAGLVTLLALGLGACGERTADGASSTGPGSAPSTTSSEAPVATPTDPPAIAHPTAPDEVVLRIVTGGGYVAASYAFTNQPTLLLLGDGRVVLPDATDPNVDGKRLSSLHVVQADEATVQQVLALAEQHHLLQRPPSYDDRDNPIVSDAPTTVVTVTADGVTRDHAAYALDLFDQQAETGKRAELADFIAQVSDLFADAPSTPYVPTELRLLVQPYGGEPGKHSTVVSWPGSRSDSGVDLAATTGCVTASAAGLVDALSAADFTTYFGQDGVVYDVSAAALLPDETGCPAEF